MTAKSLTDAYDIAARNGIYLKKVTGDFGIGYAPRTVVDQFPDPGTHIKQGSAVKIFVASDVAQVIVPDLVGKDLKEAEDFLRQNKLKRGRLVALSARDVLLDTVVAQGRSAGSKVPEGAAIDLLVSRGADPPSYIMPDLIGKEAAKVLTFFESKGLKISKIEEIPYFGLKAGIILKQFPAPGFEIGPRNLIGLQVSK